MENKMLFLKPELVFTLYDEKLPPKKPCVYRFHNSKKEVIYVGQTINLKQRINQHKSDDSKTKVIMNEVEIISYYENEDMKIIEYLEKIFIYVHNETVYNKNLNPNKDRFNLKSITNENKNRFFRFLDSLRIKDVLYKRPLDIFDEFLFFVKNDFVEGEDDITVENGGAYKRSLIKEIKKRFNLEIGVKRINGKCTKVLVQKRIKS